MADEILVLKGEGQVDVQPGGPGNPWKYLSACASMSGPTVPKGETEIRWCQDPKKAGKFRISSKFRTAPDQITFDLMTKLGKLDYLNGLDCPFGIRARWLPESSGGEREDPSQWDPIMLEYCDAELNEHSYDDLVVVDPGNQDEILVTAPVSARYELRIKKMGGNRFGSATSLGDQPINDVEFCGDLSCEDRTDECSTIYAVTDVDTTPYASPNLIKVTYDPDTNAPTITNVPILGFNSNIEGLECAGSRLLVSSNGDSAVAYNDNDGDQDSWTIVTLANAPAANHNALYARTAREIWVGCANGFVYKSVDGGGSFSAVHSGDLTSQTINAISAYDANLIVAVGNNGAMIKSTNGGQSWTDITETSTTGDNLLDVEIPPDRGKEIYVGTNSGTIYRSKDEGATFSSYTFEGSGVGTVDDIEFCGECGSEVMFILHNDGGPRGRLLRDLSGGAGGADVEVVLDYTDLILAGIQLNSISCCDGNTVAIGGENNGGYPVITKVA